MTTSIRPALRVCGLVALVPLAAVRAAYGQNVTFTLSGWAIDAASTSGPGVTGVYPYSYWEPGLRRATDILGPDVVPEFRDG